MDSSKIQTDDIVAETRILTGFRRAAPILMLTLPLLIYWLLICITQYDGAMQIPLSNLALRDFLSHLDRPSLSGLSIFILWYLLQIALQAYAPGRWVEGLPLRDGTRLKYKMNGIFSFYFTLGLLGLLVWSGTVPATLLADYFGELVTIANIFAFGFSIYLYRYGRQQPVGEISSGKTVCDYFMGTALNPRIGTFDLKLFFEARPGLILWVLIDLSFAAKQYQLHDTISLPMILVCFFHFFYVADYYYNERRVLSTMDIKHENFGWMLCWGSAVWVPFTYTLQAMYLVNHPHSLPWWGAVGIVILNFIGYAFFRASNSQKDSFRADPQRLIWGKSPTYIQTQRGSLLLASGWWGVSRHINYLGDLMMALAWCLPCLFEHPLPYFYFVYFAWLLLHRQWRDDKMCAAKYGKDWETYCAKVKWKIIPKVY